MGTLPTDVPPMAQPFALGVRPSPAAVPSGEKSYLVAALLAWFLGFLGVDRFYLGYIGLGVVKLLTCGGCGIWALIDFILILAGVLKDANGNELRRNPYDWVIILVIVVATILLNIFYGAFSILAGLLQQRGGVPVFKPIP